ncbi:hypothetical protein [Methylobacterium sp. Leaf93]|uniref:hypothetical protein n=1 Tax=Methylobacterium sp. Leaf93 TaxID=1736249 RepID=UPI0006F64EE0|nr:hypothetical protein [Methylobacterium sp. Leaf93]KQP12425.1 hypothetical protein ASF26_19915 [Methylobacterium sp. Leaf93]
MNTRLASAVAAVVLSVATVASPALAQSYTAPAGISAHAAPGYAGRQTVVDDDLTTGSIVARRDSDSAREGNAEQNSFPVWQYGRTSGGPR